MAKQGTNGLRKDPSDLADDRDSRLIRSAESLGRVIGTLQRQVHGATTRVARGAARAGASSKTKRSSRAAAAGTGRGRARAETASTGTPNKPDSRKPVRSSALPTQGTTKRRSARESRKKKPAAATKRAGTASKKKTRPPPAHRRT